MHLDTSYLVGKYLRKSDECRDYGKGGRQGSFEEFRIDKARYCSPLLDSLSLLMSIDAKAAD